MKRPQVTKKEKEARSYRFNLLGRIGQIFKFFFDSRIPIGRKILVALAIIYIISPIDIIPDAAPIIGWLDDLGIGVFAVRYIFSQMDKVSSDDSE